MLSRLHGLLVALPVRLLNGLRSLLAIRLRLKAVSNLPAILIGLLVVMIVASIAVLVGGIFDATTQQAFTDTGLNGTLWDTLRGRVSTYAQQGINIAIIGVIIAAAVGILGIVMSIRQAA